MKNEVFTFLDITGIAAFSISGAFAAMEKKLDVFGIFVVAFITALGGGTIRDVLIGDYPVIWMRSNHYTLVIFFTASIAMLFHKVIGNYNKVLMFFDSLGLGFFTLVGIHKGIEFGFTPGICIAIGTVTACFGGLIRDISLNDIPHIFHKEIYATPCIFGGLLYFLLRKASVHPDVVDGFCIALIFALRLLAVRYNWRLPGVNRTAKTM